jgi:chemotaxis protein CheZ
MAAPRKVFRIEKMTASRFDPNSDEPRPPLHGDIMRELNALRAMLAAAPATRPAQTSPAQHDEIGRLVSELRLIHSAIRGAGQQRSVNGGPAPATAARIANELEAVIGDSELATQKILAAAEDIDQAANNLAAALKGDFERGLAQDIRDRVIQIFEACNFQDLTSQRVAKVIAAFAALERQIARALDELVRLSTPSLLHGPRLASDPGHVSQSDVDSLFAGGVRSG